MPENIKESLEHLQVIFQTLGEAVFVQDQAYCCIYSNDLAAQYCGFKSADEFVGVSIDKLIVNFELLTEDRLPFPPDRLTARRALNGEEVAEAIYLFQDKLTKQEKFTKSTSRPIRDRDGKILHAVTIFRDITDEKVREENSLLLIEAGVLFSRSLKLDDILVSLGEIIVPRIADWYGVEFVDEAGFLKTMHVAHRDPSKVQTALAMRAAFPAHPSDFAGPYKVLRTGEPQLIPSLPADIIEKIAKSPEHKELLDSLTICSVINVPLKIRDEIVGVINLCQSESQRLFSKRELHLAMDISARVGAAIENSRLYESLEMEKKNADFASRAKSLFLANMSHEIRTPMNAILGFAKLLQESSLPLPEQRDFVGRIVTNGGHLLHLIDDILDLSKVEAGQMRIELRPVNIRRLLNDVYRELEILVAERKLETKMTIADDLPDFMESDGVRIKQVLINLISNAAKFTEHGSITVDAYGKRGIFCVDVRDSGIGMSEEFQEHLFQAFSQGDSSITRRYGGTGLGLVLSRKISEILGGRLLLVESAKNRGSLFRMELPLVKAHAVPLEHTPNPSAPRLQIDAPVRILLAEDTADNRALVRACLRHSPVTLVYATNGKEAVDAVKADSFDLILMDIQMPEMDGLEATQKIRAFGFRGPVIALTAHALAEEMQRSLDAGCNSHLTKPISRDALLQEITKQLRGHS